MDVTIETITPEVAKSYLGGNTANRKIKPPHVAAIVRDIKSGNWHMNGDAIRFNGDGTLLDGQHRLQAIVNAGMPVSTLVVRGISTSARGTIDTGVRRGAGDTMAINGVKNANATAAACRYAMIMQTQEMHSLTFTVSEVLDFLDANPDIEYVVGAAPRSLPGMVSIISACKFIANRIAPQVADPWLESWASGGGEKGNPCLAAREKLINAQLRGVKLPTRDKYKAVAWSLSKTIRGEAATIMRIPAKIILPGWNT